MDRTETAFLKQARRGSRVWRMRYWLAFATTAALLLAAGWTLWSTWRAGTIAEEFFSVLVWLALAAAAGMWAIHAQLMQGAALHLERREAPA